MKRRINPARMAQACVTTLACLAMLWLATTRCYQYFVTPRTLPYLYFAAAAFGAMGIYNFGRLRETSHVRRYATLLSLVIPLALLGYSAYAQNLLGTPLFPTPVSSAYNDPALLGEPYTMQTPAYVGRIIHGYDQPNRTITVMENETYLWLTEIYRDPTPFLGFTLHTMGRVVTSSPYLSDGCFSPARKLMTCCVADMFSVGFTCQYDREQELTEGEWVSVSGTITMADMEEYQELRILADTVAPCLPPDEPYVYSY